MKFYKNYIKKIIFEELSEELKQQLVRAFIKARDDSNIQQLISTIKNLGINDPLTAIQYLKKDEVDTRFYINCIELHNSMARELNQPEKSLNVDAFPKFPDTGMNYDRTPRGNKEINTQDLKLTDDRAERKNLKGGVSESRLRQIIKEEIENEKEEAFKFLIRKCAKVVEKYQNTHFMSEILRMEEVKLLIDKIYSLGYTDENIIDKLIEFDDQHTLPKIIIDRATDLFNEYTSGKDIDDGKAW